MALGRATAATGRPGPASRTRISLLLPAMCLALCAMAGWARAQGAAPIHLQIVGGLGGVSQYTRLEEPFWRSIVPQISGGRITASIRPLDAGGLRGQEMLQLMRLGVVPFGSALLSVVSGDEPELNAMDLPVLNPDIATLRRTVDVFRRHLASVLRERYDIELLAIYTYPAQVLFCTRPFRGLDDLAGRKVRTSSVGQSELVAALGAVSVMMPFAQTLAALRDGVADCAVTGTLSGYEIGLPGIATHVHSMAISWGLSIFGANATAWEALPENLQEILRTGLADLEQRIWAQAADDVERGLACNTGAAACGATPGRMTLVPTSPADEERRRTLLKDVVLPRWIERCGETCAFSWNTYLAPTHALRLPVE